MNWKKLFGINKRNAWSYVNPNINGNICFTPFAPRGSAMTISAVYRAVGLISDSLAMLPIKILQTDVENTKNEITNHPLNLIFKDRSGNLLTMYNFIKLLVQSVMLRGNGFAYIDRAEDATVRGIYYIHPDDVVINYSKEKQTLYYTIAPFGAQHIEPCNMLHLLKNTYDGVNGLSILTFAHESVYLTKATDAAASNFFDHGCNLSGILTVQGMNQKKQREQIREQWQQNLGGNKSGSIAILEGNMTYQPVSISSKDAQLLEARQYNVQDIARFFEVNPVLLGDLSHTSYNSLEQIQLDFLIHTLQPYVTLFEKEFNRKLLKPSESNLQIVFETNEILRIDKNAQASYYTQMINNGIISRNEARRELGYNPVEGGDDLIIPFTKIEDNVVNSNNSDNNQTNTIEEND